MSRQSELAELSRVYDSSALSNRRLTINGAMNVAQRGTSTTGVGDGTAGYLTVDRFRFQKAGSPTARYTMTQNSDSPDGFSNSLKLEVTTADTSVGASEHQYIDQFIEAQDIQHLAWDTSSSGKSVTLSFYVKCSTAQTFAVDLINEDNSRYFNTTYAVSSANTWEYKTITIPADASNGFNDDNGRGLRIRWSLAAGSNLTDGSVSTAWSGTQHTATNHENTWIGATGRTWQLTGVQLELGDTATPFEHRSYGDELRRCQRYTSIISAAGHTPSTDSAYARYITFGTSATVSKWINTLPVTMRATPTLITKDFTASNVQIYNYSDDAVRTFSSVALTESGKNSIQANFTIASGGGNGKAITWRWNNNPNAYIGFDAEL